MTAITSNPPPLRCVICNRVARFFIEQLTKKRKKITKWLQNISNGYKIYQMATKYTKWLQNIPNGFKIYQMGETLVL
jgi:hypothetical protein